MLNFINYKKLTVNGILAVLVAGSLIVPSNLVDASTTTTSKMCKSNNGHGNNKPIDIKLSDGIRIVGTYDPSNPGNSAQNRLTVYDSSGRTINYNTLTTAQLTEFNNIAQALDIELRGRSSSATCVEKRPGQESQAAANLTSPIAADDYFEVFINQTINLPILNNDSALSNQKVTIPATIPGASSWALNSDNTVKYTAGSVAGRYTFDYTLAIQDNVNLSDFATVTVMVKPFAD